MYTVTLSPSKISQAVMLLYPHPRFHRLWCCFIPIQDFTGCDVTPAAQEVHVRTESHMEIATTCWIAPPSTTWCQTPTAWCQTPTAWCQTPTAWCQTPNAWCQTLAWSDSLCLVSHPLCLVSESQHLVSESLCLVAVPHCLVWGPLCLVHGMDKR